MKAGLRTTELWLAVAGIVCATLMLSLDKIDANLWVTVITGASGAYSISRGIAKTASGTEDLSAGGDI